MRGELKAARKALGARERIAAAEGLAHQLAALPELSRPGYVAGYWAMDGEMPLHAVMPRLADRVVWCLPRLVDGKRLVFAPWHAGDPLVANRFGIPEPDVDLRSCLEPAALGVVLAPVVGFDRRGHRLGTGGGYYDRSFGFRLDAGAPPLLVGIGYAMQELPAIDARPWDVPMDLVATESELIDCRTTRPTE
jgi:5-formyltetrahydrofolate cyclo-ligase